MLKPSKVFTTFLTLLPVFQEAIAWYWWSNPAQNKHKAGKDCRPEEKRGDRGWDGWIASPARWTLVWANSRRQWRTGKPGMLQSVESQRVGPNWVTEQQATKQTNKLSASRSLIWKSSPAWQEVPPGNLSADTSHPGINFPCTPTAGVLVCLASGDYMFPVLISTPRKHPGSSPSSHVRGNPSSEASPRFLKLYLGRHPQQQRIAFYLHLLKTRTMS